MEGILRINPSVLNKNSESIGIIGLGSDAASQLEKFDLVPPDKIITFTTLKINYESIENLCDSCYIIFLVVNLEDKVLDKSLPDFISYLKSFNPNVVLLLKNAYRLTKSSSVIYENISYVDLDRQENNTILWTLKRLHRIVYYRNDEYDWADANYPPYMFWDIFFKTNSEIFIYQQSNAVDFIEILETNDDMKEKLDISRQCCIRFFYIDDNEKQLLVDKVNGYLYEDAELLVKDVGSVDYPFKGVLLLFKS